MSKADVRIDGIDLQILKILTHNCRTSFRNIGKTLSISANTARKRINNLILNEVIEQFTTLVNFSLLGYRDVLTVLLKIDKNRHNVSEEVVKCMRDFGTIYAYRSIGWSSCFWHRG